MPTIPEMGWAQRFFRMSPDMLGILDLEWRLKKVNPAWERALGLPIDNILGRALNHLSHPDDRARFGAVAEELADGREVVGFELRLATADGGWRTVLWSASASAEEQLIYAIGRDITDRKQAEQLLEEKSRLVALSNAELSRFASIVSHDLQAPVRKIMLFAERLRALYGDQLSPGAQEYLTRIYGSSERVHGLIGDLLSYSRAAANPITFQSVDLGVVVRQVLSDLEEVIHEKGAIVNVGPLPTLESSRTLMHQLLQNLIGNALKFHKKDEVPRVEVSAEWDTRVARITVRDHGIGLDERYAPRIFGIFQRLHRAEEYGGNGVGLAICARIAERHGGLITVRSQPGEGARFQVVLPIHQPIPGEPSGL